MIDETPVWRRDRPRRRNFEWSFGSAVAAIVVGTIIATGIVWFAAEVRARYELRQLDLAIAAETRKIEAELQAQRKAEEDRQPLTSERCTPILSANALSDAMERLSRALSSSALAFDMFNFP